MIFGIEPTKVDFFLGHHGPPHFFSTWKKWTPQPKFHRLNSDLLGTCQGPHWQGTACAFAWVPYLGAWVSGSKPDQTVETQNQKCDKNLQKTTKKKASKGDVFLKAKVAAQYWQLWTSQEQGGRNESGGISAYHNIYATKKWTHAHMAASPICFVSNSWQFARKWCSQLLNGRIWVGWQFQIN